MESGKESSSVQYVPCIFILLFCSRCCLFSLFAVCALICGCLYFPLPSDRVHVGKHANLWGSSELGAVMHKYSQTTCTFREASKIVIIKVTGLCLYQDPASRSGQTHGVRRFVIQLRFIFCFAKYMWGKIGKQIKVFRVGGRKFSS